MRYDIVNNSRRRLVYAIPIRRAGDMSMGHGGKDTPGRGTAMEGRSERVALGKKGGRKVCTKDAA
jgi:hypothetical protein